MSEDTNVPVQVITQFPAVSLNILLLHLPHRPEVHRLSEGNALGIISVKPSAHLWIEKVNSSMSAAPKNA